MERGVLRLRLFLRRRVQHQDHTSQSQCSRVSKLQPFLPDDQDYPYFSSNATLLRKPLSKSRKVKAMVTQRTKTTGIISADARGYILMHGCCCKRYRRSSIPPMILPVYTFSYLLRFRLQKCFASSPIGGGRYRFRKTMAVGQWLEEYRQ